MTIIAVCSDGLRSGEHPRTITHQEAAVWRLLGTEGLSNQEIAVRLGMADGTVRTHLRSLLAKFRVDNRTQLALLWRDAHERGEA